MGDQDNRQSMSDPAFQQAVEETAYFLWEHDGRPQGRETDYWFRALEQTLRQRNADLDLSQKPSVHHTGHVDDNQDDLGRDITDGPTGDEQFHSHH
ncbi:MAG: DUF2934 domain-containing protein [Devosia sp.]